MQRNTTEGDSGYIREMLNQWLKWVPPNHEQPTLTALETALQNCQQERLAETLRARFMQKKGTCLYNSVGNYSLTFSIIVV